MLSSSEVEEKSDDEKVKSGADKSEVKWLAFEEWQGVVGVLGGLSAMDKAYEQ